MASVLWLRRDLRRGDHPALLAASGQGAPAEVSVVFVIDPALWHGAGPVRRAWLAASLRAARSEYADRLVVRTGDPRMVLPAVAREVGADTVHVSRETTAYGVRRDAAVNKALQEVGVAWQEAGTPYAVGPGQIRTAAGTPYKVFSPFARAWREHGWPQPAPEPRHLHLTELPRDPESERLLDDALAHPDLPKLPEAGERSALARWGTFRDETLPNYEQGRDRPDLQGTSQLSPYLKVGAVHPRTLLADLPDEGAPGVERFVTELAWREFYADVLWHRPDSAWQDLRTQLAGLRYDQPEDAVQAWKVGETGYPIVDAGMRQLLTTGWMHNRLRMITASFLTKDLHVWWPIGARWFLDRLIDGDIASNNHGWQWVAGTGTDAAPYFRVFNPVRQGQRFDPNGDYVRRWVPELAHLAGVAVHEPWVHPEGFAHGYPPRIVDHGEERREALRRYEKAKSANM